MSTACAPGCPCNCHGRPARQRSSAPTPGQVRRDLRARGMRVLGRYPLLSVKRVGTADALALDASAVVPGAGVLYAQNHPGFAVVVIRVAIAGER